MPLGIVLRERGQRNDGDTGMLNSGFGKCFIVEHQGNTRERKGKFGQQEVVMGAN